MPDSLPAPRPFDDRLILATDLDGTFLGGQEPDRLALYRWIEQWRETVTLIFVTGRDLPFIRQLVAEGPVPQPDYVIGDVGTSIAGGPGIEPLAHLEEHIARAWGDAGARMQALLEDEPGLRLQDTPFRYRLSYTYDPECLSEETARKVEKAGFDCLISAGIFLDVLPPGVSKGPTLLHLADSLGLPKRDILVAGDTLNDLSLFETGLPGVAVGNAEAALTDRTRKLPNVFHSPHPGAAGILDAIRHYAQKAEAQE